MIRASRLANELQSASEKPGEVARAAAAGLGTGGKAVVNGTATAIKNVATLGLSDSQLELIGVTQADRDRGYNTAVSIPTASGEVLIAVGTGGVASALSKGGTVARTTSGALIAFDAAGNAVGVVRGGLDASTNRLTFANGARIAAGTLGLSANARAIKSAKPGNSVVKLPSARGGRYGHLNDPSDSNSGKRFTRDQKKLILAENQRRNGGALRDDRTNETLVPPQQRQKGQKAPPNEAQVDHVYPRSLGGPNTFSNSEVRSMLNNLRKGKRLE